VKAIKLGYEYESTGFGEQNIKITSSAVIFPPKLLWDWLNLLGIPFVLLVVGFVLNQSEDRRKREIAKEEGETERSIAKENRKAEQEQAKESFRESSLQNYIDKMTQLLLEYKLNTFSNINVSNIARAKTLAVVPVLDGKRKGLVLKFLFDAGLISGVHPIVNLEYADFSGTEYSRAYLGDANLKNVELPAAKLPGVEFNGAILTGTVFNNATLTGARFKKTKFIETKLDNADMAGINVIGSTLLRTRFKNSDSFGKEVNTHLDLYDSTWESCIFEECEFSGSQLLSTTMTDLVFKSTKFDRVKMQKSRIKNVDFSGAKFSQTDFYDSVFHSPNFANTDLYEVNFEHAQLPGANFANSIMNKVNFKKAVVHFIKRIGDEEKEPDADFSGSKMINKIVINSDNFTESQLDQPLEKGGIIPDPSQRSRKWQGIFFRAFPFAKRLVGDKIK